MGLDQYAYVAAKAGAYGEYWGDENYNKEDSDPTKFPKPREMSYWRKHANLQGWMKQLWEEKNPDDVEGNSFNGIELELTWADIDLQSRSIFVQVSKNGESRQIPLTKEAQNVLKNLPIDQSGKVFPITFTQLRSQFKRVKNYAKNKWGEPGINPYEDLRFHDLRHEALSRFSDAGLNIIELSCISGHKTLAMLQRYTHPAYEAIFLKLDKNEPKGD